MKLFNLDIAKAAKNVGKAAMPAISGAASAELGGRLLRSVDAVERFANKSTFNEGLTDMAAGVGGAVAAYKLTSKKWGTKSAQDFSMLMLLGSGLWSFAAPINTLIDKAGVAVGKVLPGAASSKKSFVPPAKVNPRIAAPQPRGGPSMSDDTRTAKKSWL